MMNFDKVRYTEEFISCQKCTDCGLLNPGCVLCGLCAEAERINENMTKYNMPTVCSD